MFSLVILTYLGLAVAACTRYVLKEVTAGYLAALAVGKLAIKGLAGGTVIYQENDVVLDISNGVLSQGVSIHFNRSPYDTTECASYTEVVDWKAPVCDWNTTGCDRQQNHKDRIRGLRQRRLALQCRRVSAIQQAGELGRPPEGKRDKRDVIKTAGDAYIDAWGDSSVHPPFGKSCARLEGSSYLTGNCKLNFQPPFKVTNRRYTIDKELGAVDIFHNFPFLDKAVPRDPGTQTNNLLRVEGGQIKYIHENTVCLKKSYAK